MLKSYMRNNYEMKSYCKVSLKNAFSGARRPEGE